MSGCLLRATGGVTILGLLAVAMSSPLAAHPFVHKLEVLTFKAPASLPGVTLVAGEYSFELTREGGEDVVRVRYRKTNHLTFAGITRRIVRPRGLRSEHSLMLDRAATGGTARILAWFPCDQEIGFQFIW
jgi:hypothetical protein